MRHIQSFTNDAAIQDALDNKTLGKPYVALNNQTGEIDWDEKDPGFIAQYFTIEVISAGTVNLTLATGGTVNMQYSVDGGQTWQNNASINAQPGDKIMYKGNNDSLSLLDTETSPFWVVSTFSNSTSSYKAYGNIMSLLYGDDFAGRTAFPSSSQYAFKQLFYSCTGLTDVSNLVLPALSLAEGCYQDMFFNCTSLTTAPSLPATVLGVYCYDSMFAGCSSLTQAPALPATTMANNCYRGMFQGCTSLTTAPVLPAPTLVQFCYRWMFQSCTNLNYIKCLATDISADRCVLKWTDRVAATGTFVKDPSMASWTTGIDGIPSDWTVVDATEE